MADFPSLEFVQALQKRCNESEQFRKATEWSDVNVVLAFGDQRYWLKLYRGQSLDPMEYRPLSNAYGYDVLVSGQMDGWRDLLEGKMKFWGPLSQGRITIEGNLLEANRIHEAIYIMGETLHDVGEGG
jgi:hypothetical protein